MGKLFIVHPGGKHIYSCKDCKTPIAAKRDFIDRCKTLVSARSFAKLLSHLTNTLCKVINQRALQVNGQGLLFSSSCNVRESHMSERITAFDAEYNIVRLLSCLKCKAYMGWR